ncbi:MAG: serine/threonine-protein kinase [Vicinamibacterales bacterium]
MTPETWPRVRALFDEAVDLDAAGRERVLQRAGPDERRAVERLLLAHAAASALDRPVYEVAAAVVADDDRLADGSTLGPYVVRQVVGRGGMGTVYLAEDTRLGRRVALKMLSSPAGLEADQAQRLRTEARAAAALVHPGVATVHALEEIAGRLVLVSEYVPGPTLRAVIEAGGLSLARVVDMLHQTACALDAAHVAGVVHRDLKPENVVRTPSGAVKILDFGVARAEGLIDGSATETAHAGTPGYMAPEQAATGASDFRADLYAFGILAGELLAAVPVEAADSSGAGTAGATALREVIERCTRPHPGDRYEATHVLVAELGRLQDRLSAGPAWAGIPGSGTARSARPPRPGARRFTPRWWWEFHQGAVTVVHLAALYPAWLVVRGLRGAGAWSTVAVLAFMLALTLSATIRLHLWFVSRAFDDAHLDSQRRRVRPWVRLSDTVVTVGVLAAAVAALDGARPLGMLLLALGGVSAVTAVFIEPSTVRAAFPSDG